MRSRPLHTTLTTIRKLSDTRATKGDKLCFDQRLAGIFFPVPDVISPAHDAVPAGSMLYPWASYRGGRNGRPIYQHGPVTSWENLVNYATHYKRISATSSGRLTTPTHSVHIFGNSYNFLHRVRILPVIARVHWVLSHSAGAIANDDEKLQPRVLLTPVVTVWNPYSMALTSPNLNLRVVAPLPIALRYTINGTPNTHYNSLMAGSYNNKPSLSNSNSLIYSITNSGVLMPGETRIFSPAATSRCRGQLPRCQSHRQPPV